MILAAIDIENYKQYVGCHRIEFPEQGMVAITGPNGSGKTTLFEAIEWCLYGPRSIPLATIPPHGGVGRTTVRVTLESPGEGIRYVVERQRRPGGATHAEVYLEDQPDRPLVHGSHDVSDYVAKSLIGLPHGAFVSTFFTRQKELTFFGDLKPTDRRVEVARLLGFQTIREAQNDLAAERTQARNIATSLRSQYDRDAAGRDFAAELAAAETAVAGAMARHSTAESAAEAAEDQAEQTRVALHHWQGLQEQDATFDRELVRLTGEIAVTDASRIGAEAELRRLAQRSDERATLLPQAAQADALAFEAGLLDEQRALAERLRSLAEAHRAATGRLDSIASRLRSLVLEHRDAAAGVVAWTWSDADDASPERGAARLREAAASTDPDEHRNRVERLVLVRTCARNATTAGGSLAKLRTHFDTLTAEREALLATGDPQIDLTDAERAERQARDAAQTAQQTAAAARKSRVESERLVRGLREEIDDVVCPTCTRPLPPADAQRIVALLLAEVERLLAEEGAAATIIAETEPAIAAAKHAQAAARERQGALLVIEGRLEDGAAQIESAVSAHNDCLTQLHSALADALVTAEPHDDDIDSARQLADRVQRIAGVVPLLDQLSSQAIETRTAIDETQGAIEAIGPVTYDPEAHQRAQTSLAAARGAQVQIAQIDKELADRARYETQRDAAARALVGFEASRSEVATERLALGFDPAALAAARTAEAAARTAAQDARGALAESGAALHQAQTLFRRVVEDRDRLQRLAEEADHQGREADELERMVREFAEFDRFVADRVGPLLADTTERLLAQVTDGKYDHVRFDENYGIEVYDGDEAFDLAGFSGGERDVVSLCARLAMSELIGSAARRPPRFLVLDEVFGSLDSERRAQLLGTLGALASSGHFQQMFIISHVDDVQQSHVMDEAWTIEERDGASHINRPGLTSAALLRENG